MYRPSRIGLLFAVTLVLATVPAAMAFAAGPPRLLVGFGLGFRVRPATVDLGNVLVTGPNVTARDLRAGRHGHLAWTRWTRSEARARGRIWIPTGPPNVPNSQKQLSPFQLAFRAWRVRNGRYTREWYAYTYRGRRHQTWTNLVRSRGAWDWRVVRFT